MNDFLQKNIETSQNLSFWDRCEKGENLETFFTFTICSKSAWIVFKTEKFHGTNLILQDVRSFKYK